MQDPYAQSVGRMLDGRQVQFRYIDRRIVGSDWLSGPYASSPKSRKRIVFGSLKGGVGRSTALVVAAAHFARQGLRVLTIDLDLEAPGIGSMLLACKPLDGIDQRPRYGVIDYLLEEQVGQVHDHQLIDFIGKSAFSEGFIDVLPAVGRETESRPTDFIPKLSRALTDGVEDGRLIAFHEKIRSMIARFEDAGIYDIILIDARAGIAEISAAPLMTLGANVLLFATNQQQTFTDYSYLISYMSSQTDFSAITTDNDWRSTISFVQSKAAGSERGRLVFRNRVYDLCSKWLYEEGDDESTFNYSANETGVFVPHDATFVKFDPFYEAFDPTLDGDQLDSEVYSGPFGALLTHLDNLIRFEDA